MRVTLADVAKRVGVTPTTVSVVLNGSSTNIGVSKATRQKVLLAAEELNYLPSLTARSLAKGKTLTLGMVVGDIHTPHFSEMTNFALQDAETRGYHLLLSLTQWSFEKEMAAIDMLLKRRVDGLLIISSRLKPGVKQYEYLVQQKIPAVLLGAQLEGFASVVSDFVPGTLETLEYLKSKGHRRIAQIRATTLKNLKDSKIEPFEDGCQKLDLAWTSYECLPDPKVARELGRRIAGEVSRPTALLAISDYMCTGLIRGLTESGLRVPEDIAVVGCDGTQLGEFFTPNLTSIFQDRQQIIAQALTHLLEIIQDADIPRRSIKVPTKLLIRESA